MGRKNPWAAAVLNFFLPGIGFAYLGEGRYIAIGLALLALSLAEYTLFPWLLANPLYLLLGLLLDLVYAALAYVAAEHVNLMRAEAPSQPRETAGPPPPPPREPMPQAPQQGVFCRHCGSPNPLDAVYCQRCGRRTA